ncbi:MAG: hypothetical protein WAN53_07115, partial [Candidatus Bathyarchaeia archaeon]
VRYYGLSLCFTRHHHGPKARVLYTEASTDFPVSGPGRGGLASCRNGSLIAGRLLVETPKSRAGRGIADVAL